MDGLAIAVTGLSGLPDDAPVIPVIDEIESAGSVLLIEPAHPANPWAAGVPADAASLPNLLSAELSTGDLTFELGGAINNGVKGKLERSASGGLHVIVSQANALASGDGVAIKAATALRDYLNANDTHDFYISVWDRVTRAALDNSISPVYDYPIFSDVATSGRGLAGAGAYGWLPTGAGTGTIGSSKTLGSTGMRRGSAEVTAYLEPSTQGMWVGPVWGAPATTLGAGHIASRNQKYTSYCFYRLYIEDLTASGRTYAQVDAKDEELFTLHVLTAGGRYYGDTMPTDPTTIP